MGKMGAKVHERREHCKRASTWSLRWRGNNLGHHFLSFARSYTICMRFNTIISTSELSLGNAVGGEESKMMGPSERPMGLVDSVER